MSSGRAGDRDDEIGHLVADSNIGHCGAGGHDVVERHDRFDGFDRVDDTDVLHQLRLLGLETRRVPGRLRKSVATLWPQRDVLLGKRTYLSPEGDVRIVDWRNAPISRIFYQYGEGDDYEYVEYELFARYARTIALLETGRRDAATEAASELERVAGRLEEMGSMAKLKRPQQIMAINEAIVIARLERADGNPAGGIPEPDIRAVARVATEACQPDLIVMAVKAHQLADAIEQVRPAVGPETRLLPFQNGVDAPDMLARAFGPDRAPIGVSRFFDSFDAMK